MKKYYTAETSVQILIALLKSHKIRKVVASPGSANIFFVGRIQQDDYFEIYSAVDERSAAYMACGLAAESGEAVVLSCTGATASRNYMPALTEAYYRKLPVLAVTSTQRTERIGHNIQQVIDRTVLPNDIAKMSIQVPEIHNSEDAWACEININKALLELFHNGGGPVHINLVTTSSQDFSVKELPQVKTVKRYGYMDELPELKHGRTAIFVGAHKAWSDELTAAVDEFCEKYNAVVICDHTSNYAGKYGVHAALVLGQMQYKSPNLVSIDTLIDVGDTTGISVSVLPKQTWRINPDGELRDNTKSLTAVFEMEELCFFQKYNSRIQHKSETDFAKLCQAEWKQLSDKIPELPFSNIWIASQTASRIPEGAVLHLGILNSLRSWNFFSIPESVRVYSNTGGFGIDGNTSTLIGASLAHPEKLYFGIVGDLSFFYDMNSIGNRHVGNNLRLMVINNGRGTEFRLFNSLGERFGEEADKYIAGAGHFGNKSPLLIKHYAEDLGFTYLTASNKEEYLNAVEMFVNPNMAEHPILFEVFTNSQDESDALQKIKNVETSAMGVAKQVAKQVLGQKGIQSIKEFMKK